MSDPVLQALLVADQVYQDASTGKKVICGVFHTLFIRGNETKIKDEEIKHNDDGAKGVSVPIEELRSAGSPFCYISLTELQGDKSFELRFVSLKTYSLLFNSEFNVKCESPLEVIEIVIPLPTLNVSGSGEYSLELLCDDTLLGSHRINAIIDPNL